VAERVTMGSFVSKEDVEGSIRFATCGPVLPGQRCGARIAR
jgi:hypothetical protein